MGMTRGDYEFYQGYKAGYEQAITDVRQELLALQYDKHKPVRLEIYKVLNNLAKELRGGNGQAINLPACENENDLVFNNID